MSCCGNHPDECVSVGLEILVGLALIGCTFGWRWVGVFLIIIGGLDWLIRVWKVK